MSTAEATRAAGTTDRKPWADLRDGALAMAPLAAGYAPFGLVIGMAAAASRDPLAAWAGSVLIFAGSAHLLVIDLVGSGAGVWAAVAAAVVVNARLLVFSATLAPLWRGTSVLRRLAAAVVVIDPVWALTTRRLAQAGTGGAARRYYTGAALVLLLTWPAAMAAGALMGAQASATGAGVTSLLQMCVPACLVAVVGAHLRTPAGARAVLAAVVVAWFGRGWPTGTGLLAAMVAAGLAGSGLRSRGGEQ